MVEKEEFRDIKGYEGHYQVSNFGRVRSLKNYGGVCCRILKQAENGFGYAHVGLWLDGKRKNHRVYQLVAIAFLNHIPDGHKTAVDHIDGNRKNNDLSNLQVVTQRQNTSTCFRIGENSFSSKKIGVCWHKVARKWMASIRIGKQLKYLGLFDCEIKAGEAYQKALKEHLQNNQTKK